LKKVRPFEKTSRKGNIIMGLTPVHFFSHGSTRMLEADTESGSHWEQCGRDALAHGVKGIIIMVSSSTSFVVDTALNVDRALTGPVLETG
jgi:aromatic ring-opening dioxygenase catalytic subunit (LigB family)